LSCTRIGCEEDKGENETQGGQGEEGVKRKRRKGAGRGKKGSGMIETISWTGQLHAAGDLTPGTIG
jgi:hypothetical protein